MKSVKAWDALSKFTGIDHTHLAKTREDEKIRYRDIQAQPRKIISAPTWSGIESEHVSYNAGYTNVHELIPWRTMIVNSCIKIIIGCVPLAKPCVFTSHQLILPAIKQ